MILNPILQRYSSNNKLSLQPQCLIIRLKAVGDAILTTPVFRNLKRLYPEAKIDVIVYPYVYDAIKDNPYIDKIIIIKRKNFHKFAFYIKSIFRKYDIIIDYINNPTSTIIAFFTKSKIKIGTKNKRNIFYTHRLEIRERCYNAIKNLKMLRPLGLTDFSDYMPEFFVNKEDKEKAELFLKNTGIAHKKLVGIFASAKYITRKYIPEHFAKLAELIVENSNYRVLFLFGKDDIQTLERIKNSLKIEKDIYFAPLSLSIGELAAFMEKTKFIITTDTGPKHIAVALGIPTLTIFSATNPEDWNPPDLDKFPIIRKEIDCIGCNKLTCDSLRCMKELSPEEIFEVAKRFIS